MEYYYLVWIFPILGLAITFFAQVLLSTRYRKYRDWECKNEMSGFEVARKILDANGLQDIYITEVKGNLTDHYDPSRKVVRLSTDTFHGNSIASVSVAAHECGHAIQHKEGYFFIRLRSFMVPFVNLSSKLGYLAVVLGFVFNYINLAWVGIILLSCILLFQLITLPTEFNASERALVQLEKNGIINSEEQGSCKKMLSAAAFTYVAGLITSFLEIFRLFLAIAFRSRD